MTIRREMHVSREKIVDEHSCCLPFTTKFGQPALYVFETFLPAATYAEFATQEEELCTLFVNSGACNHIREIAISTHRSLCGNDRHMLTAKRALAFGMDPIAFEEVMGASL